MIVLRLINICLIGLILLAGQILLLGQFSWLKKIDNSRYDTPVGLISGDSETFYLGQRYSQGSSNPVFQQISKWSNTGQELWSIQFQNPPYNVYEGPIVLLPGKDLIACLHYQDSLEYEFNISRISPEGNVLWTTNVPGIINIDIDYAIDIYKIIPFSINDIRLYFWMNYYLENDPPAAKNGYISLDSTGIIKSWKYFDTNGEYQRPYNIIQKNDSQFIKVYRPTVSSINLLLRYELLNLDYNPIWSFEMGPQDDGAGGPVCIDSSGNTYFTWNHDTTGNGGPFFDLPSIVSLDHNGKFRWIKHFGEDRGIPVFYNIISTKDGRIIACGQEGNSTLSGGKNRTGWIVCIDNEGNKLWERRYVINEASDSGNNFYYITEQDDGGLILFGVLHKVNGSDSYVIKTNNDGCLNENCELYNFITLETSILNVIQNNINASMYISNHYLNLIIHDPITTIDFNFEIVSLTGQIISVGKITSEHSRIDISDVPVGVSFIHVRDNITNIHCVKKFFIP
jgi:hypothetical protein